MLVVQRDCRACGLVLDELPGWLADQPQLAVVSQDAGYPPDLDSLTDTDLEASRRLAVEGTPALLHLRGGEVVDRVEGWHRDEWRRISRRPRLGEQLPEAYPGCASKVIDPERPDSPVPLRARRTDLGEREDPAEAAYALGWTDGLPVIPPTPERVERMLTGTSRQPNEVVATMPPNFAKVTVEKAAINAVMAGCRPDYLPVVLAAVAAAATDTFNIHGVAATTHFVGPVVVVNGPIATAIGMNGGGNALGPGNRANITIGRALNLIVANVGGARPGGIDRSTLGSPGKLSFCFAEEEAGSPWEPLAVERGVPPGRSAVTLFAGVGPQPVVDQRSRTPESLAASLALSLRTVGHAKLAGRTDALVVIAPEHAAVFARAGWDKATLRRELLDLLTVPGAEWVAGADGIAEGLPPAAADHAVSKFRPDGLWFVHAGSSAGLHSAIIGGWVSGAAGSDMTTVEVE